MSHIEFSSFLQEHIKQNQLDNNLLFPINGILQAALAISEKLRLGELAGILGEAGSGNIQGEAQKKLDVIANDLVIEALKKCSQVAGLASEEEEHFVAVDENAPYLVLFDPLDGSSNIDINISVGTIFSILPKKSTDTLVLDDFLQSGRNQVAAGYVLYGVQTQLVLTLGHGVFAFTLDHQNRFILTRQSIQIDHKTAEFAINMSNYRHWEKPVRSYIDELLQGKEGVRGKNYNMRWVASMVAEVHRILSRGGIFMYPKDDRDSSRAGKLRLMYEANPMSFLIEQAGGGANNAHQAILDILPEGLHQRVAVILGAKEETDMLLKYHQ